MFDLRKKFHLSLQNISHVNSEYNVKSEHQIRFRIMLKKDGQTDRRTDKHKHRQTDQPLKI